MSPTSSQAFLQEIREFVSKGDLPSAFESLRELLANSPKLNKALEQENRFRSLSRDIRDGVLYREQIDVENNRVSRRLLELLDEIEGKAKVPSILDEIEQHVIHVTYVKKIPHLLTPKPFRAEVFVGREKELEAIHKQLFTHQKSPLLVHGNGGIGKTTLASQYFQHYGKYYQHIAWVLKENNIAEALLRLAPSLQVSFDEKMNTQERLDLLFTHLENLPDRAHQAPCLLVIDNADDLQDLKDQYQNLRRLTNFRVLLTSRVTQLAYAETYKVQGLHKKEVVDLFQTYYPKLTKGESKLVKEMYQAVSGNTLVLELLAKNLAQLNKLKTRYSLEDLCKDLQEKGVLRLSQSKTVSVDYGNFAEAKPEEIIEAMYDLGQLPGLERILLSVFAVLPAENILYEDLEKLLSGFPDLEPHILSLAQKGWLEYNEAETSFKSSPVIQEIVKKKNPELRRDCQPLIQVLLGKLEFKFDELKGSTYAEAAQYVRYAKAVVRVFIGPDIYFRYLCEWIGLYYFQTGDLTQALYYFERFNALARGLMELYPENPDVKNGLADSWFRIGDTKIAFGRLTQALSNFEKSKELKNQIYLTYPQRVDVKREFSVLVERIGGVYGSQGNLEKALLHYQEANSIKKELFEAYPQNEYFKKSLAISHSKLGELYNSLGDLDAALGNVRQFHVLHSELHADFPQNQDFKRGLSVAHEKLGEIFTHLGKSGEALEHFLTSYKLKEELYKENPHIVNYKHGFAISNHKLGETYRTSGEIGNALKHFRKYNRLEKKLHEDDKKNVEFMYHLAVSYLKLGNVFVDKNNYENALRKFKSCHKLAKELCRIAPDNTNFNNIFSISKGNLGDTLLNMGNYEKAITYYLQYNTLQKKLTQIDSQNVMFKDNLAGSNAKLGNLYEEKLNDTEKAKKYYHMAQKMWIELLQISPDNKKFQSNLGALEDRLKGLQA